jgi:hypothetical protein
MEDMAQDFGWSMDEDDWSVEVTDEELEQERRSQNQMIRDEMIGEMYNARFSFD